MHHSELAVKSTVQPLELFCKRLMEQFCLTCVLQLLSSLVFHPVWVTVSFLQELLSHNFPSLSLACLSSFYLFFIPFSSENNNSELPESHHRPVSSQNMVQLQRSQGPRLPLLCGQCLGTGLGLPVSARRAHTHKLITHCARLSSFVQN